MWVDVAPPCILATLMCEEGGNPPEASTLWESERGDTSFHFLVAVLVWPPDSFTSCSSSMETPVILPGMTWEVSSMTTWPRSNDHEPKGPESSGNAQTSALGWVMSQLLWAGQQE